MGTEQSASMMRIAVLAVIVAVAMSSMEQEVEVSELADAGHTAKAQLGEAKVTPAQLNAIAANNNNPDMAGTGRFKGTKTLNFPGTPYGKPGTGSRPLCSSGSTTLHSTVLRASLRRQ